ncbi:flavin reductase, partial [Mycobacterium tuberculosis]|nr:flavin reductase [Mycobacterium tuberculosis]
GFSAVVVTDATRPVAIPVGEGGTTMDLARLAMTRAGVAFAAADDLAAPAPSDGLDWEPAGNGAPVLKAAVSVFECRVAETHLVGTHHVII